MFCPPAGAEYPIFQALAHGLTGKISYSAKVLKLENEIMFQHYHEKVISVVVSRQAKKFSDAELLQAIQENISSSGI